MSGVLLDTNAFVRMVLDLPLKAAAREVMKAAAVNDDLWVSSVSAWEIGQLSVRPRTGRQLDIQGDPVAWFETGRTRSRVRSMALGSSDAILAAYLPSPFHRDPADRLLVAQARSSDLTLVTRDRAILDYAALGHVRAIAC